MNEFLKEPLRKIKMLEGGTVLNCPIEFFDLLKIYTFNFKISGLELSKQTLIFVRDRNELMDFFENNIKNLEYDGLIWIAFPKQKGKITSDINRDSIMLEAINFGYNTVTAVSFDLNWSCLRIRPMEMVGKKK